MGRSSKSVGGGLRAAAGVAIASVVLVAAASTATAARNEARWYQQNYCMVKAYEAMGKTDYATYDKNARQSRAYLKKHGVPEHHIRELETFINKTIRQTKARNNAHQGPRICMQWYST